MMAQLREQFPPPGAQPPARVLGEDYRFTPSRLPATAQFRLEHDSVRLLEQPLSLERRYRLRDDGDIPLAVTFRLCWNGGAEALESLYQFTESFQRAIPTERVRRVSDDGLGDFGLAWSWEDPLGAEVVTLVRANVLVTVQAPDGAGLAERAARAIDAELRALRTIESYPELADGALRRESTTAADVVAGARTPLGRQPATERWFFLASGGSANRDPGAPDVWYFRAGLNPGLAEIRLFRVDDGLVPVAERLSVRVR